MVFLRALVIAPVILFSLFGSLHAIPLSDKLNSLSPFARDFLKRSTPAAPRFVVYNDRWINPFPPASSLEGFNVFALSFLLANNAVDQAQNWEELTASQRSSFLSEYNAAGISLIVSAFGSTEVPTSGGYDPTTTAANMANWVIQYGVQGIDVDYEDFDAFRATTGAAETWLISFTQQLRQHLPQGQYILTHAPVAPWFSPSKWSGGGYLAIDRAVGSMIDWYNVQFYNQGSSEYTTCDGLLQTSSTNWPESALFQIVANGGPVNKLVIGKPGTTSDANTGYMDPSTLASCISQAHSQGWGAGVMAWQYPDATSAWISTVRGNTWPISGSSLPPPPPPTTTTTSVPTTSSTPGNCSGVSAWAPNVAYTKGNQVTFNGGLWTANQWNEHEQPGGGSGAWSYDGAC